MSRLAEAVCSRPACGATFQRLRHELKRPKRLFCSRACRDLAHRTGRTMVVVTCERPACGKEFPKLGTEVKRCAHHYCSTACYLAVVDRVKLALAGCLAPGRRLPDPAVRQARSRKGGLVRAARLSKERLQEIGRLAAVARLAKSSPAQRSAIARRAGVTRTGRKMWFGMNVLLERGRG